MRGGFESAARWNAHYAREAARNRDEAIRALRTLADVIQAEFPPLTASAEGFWSVWYEWAQKHEAVRVPYNNAYHYGHGGGATGRIFDEFKRIVERRPIPAEPAAQPATYQHSKAHAPARVDHGPAPEQGALGLEHVAVAATLIALSDD